VVPDARFARWGGGASAALEGLSGTRPCRSQTERRPGRLRSTSTRDLHQRWFRVRSSTSNRLLLIKIEIAFVQIAAVDRNDRLPAFALDLRIMPICGGPPTGRKAEIKLGQIAVIFFVTSQYSITQPSGKDPHSAAKDTFHIAPRSPFPILAPALMAGALVSTNFPFVSETHSSPFCPSASETKYRIFTD